MTSVAPVTVSDTAALWLWAGELASATWRVNFEVPVDAGVPVIAPAELRLKPFGRVPEITLQTYAGVPPVACRLVL